MKHLTLNNGVKIPIFGFGTYEISPDQTKKPFCLLLKMATV